MGDRRELQTLALLEALVGGSEQPAQAARQRLPELAAARLEALPSRIGFLVRRIGFKDLDPARLAAAWAEQLASKPDSSRAELLGTARRISRATERDEGPIGHWKRVLLARLEPTLSKRDTVESFAPGAAISERETHLELDPLIAAWPKRLLEHPKWAFAEAPLPEMQPLPLDDVWVELRLAESESMERLHQGQALGEVLDQRYEERSWRTRPLEFIIERFEGSAVLVGPPGSGKTTLLKWIARWLIRHPGGRFVLPLLVPLRSYGIWKKENSGSELLDFALLEAGIRDRRQRDLWSNALSYFAGPGRDNVLLLLDGWDEVRPEDREAMRQDIDNHAHGFAMILTSRPSGHPRQLPVYDIFEITELSPDSIGSLIRLWFQRVGAPQLAEPLERRLDRNLDLRRMARNPFLLSLLCGLYLRNKGKERLPRSRAALYESAVSLILRHYGDRCPEKPFGSVEQRQVERLALWLLDEAPGAPRYVFGPEDVVACCDYPELLDEYLKPSRLLGQLGLSDDSHFFLHTTFQEYLAARALTHEDTDRVVDSVRRHSYDAAWLEVMQFLAGLSGLARTVFWQEMRRISMQPDRYGLVFLRIAHFAAEAQLPNGGLTELGVDLRDKLWEGVTGSNFSGRFVEALAALDSDLLVHRMRKALAGDDEAIRKRVVRNLGRVVALEASELLVEQLLSDQPVDCGLALSQLGRYERLHPRSLAKLRLVAFARDSDATTRKKAIHALSSIRDVASVPNLVEMARQYPDEAESVLVAIGWMGGEAATAALRTMGEWHESYQWQESLVTMLGLVATPVARDLLLQRLALLDLEDPLVVIALEALHGMPIHDGADLISTILFADLPAATRAAAAHALQEATGSGVVATLARAAEGDPEESVRLAALQSLEGRGQPNEVGWLSSRIDESTRSDEERVLAFRVLLTTVQRFRYSEDGKWLLARAATAVLRALAKPAVGVLTQTATELAYLAGDATAPRLIEVALDSSLDTQLRCSACASLGRLCYVEAADSLVVLASSGRNARPRDRRPDGSGFWTQDSSIRWEVVGETWSMPAQKVHLELTEDTIGQAAADALAWIDPGALLDISGTGADNALAAWALETGSLVFKNHIVGATGKTIARRRSHSFLDASSRAVWPGLVPDLEITIEASTEQRPELTFQLQARDPSLGLVRDRFGPISLGRDPQAQQHDLSKDIEEYSSVEAEWQEISAARLRAKGTRLFGILPLGLQIWLWTLRERVQTARLVSDELFLPWEILRLSGQGAGTPENGYFLAEKFALTRWRHGLDEQLSFDLSRVAVLASAAEDNLEVQEELEDLVELLGAERVTIIPPRYREVRDALASGQFDGWHFIGHAHARSADVDLWEIVLDDYQTLRPEDLLELSGFGKHRPWVFLNACSTGLAGRGLSGPGGWALQCLESGAGAFLGTQWAVPSRQARRFAFEFYRRFLAGEPLGESVRQARIELRDEYPGSPAWLAYTVYGHPLAYCSKPIGAGVEERG